MSHEERYGVRDKAYSAWHRRGSVRRFVGIDQAQLLSMIDVDGAMYVEYDQQDKEPACPHRSGPRRRTASQERYRDSSSRHAGEPPGIPCPIPAGRQSQPRGSRLPRYLRVPGSPGMAQASERMARVVTSAVRGRVATGPPVVNQPHR